MAQNCYGINSSISAQCFPQERASAVLTSRNEKANVFAFFFFFPGIYIGYGLSALWVPLYLPIINRNLVSHIGHLLAVTKPRVITLVRCRASERCCVSMVVYAISVSNLFFHLNSSIFWSTVSQLGSVCSSDRIGYTLLRI